MRKDKKYLVNLTDHLIGRNHLDEMVDMYDDQKQFVRHVSAALEVDELAKMTGETIGGIMDLLEVGDVVTSKAELLGNLHFGGDCGDLFREFASRCVAYFIYERLLPDQMRSPTVPAYCRNKKGVDAAKV
jgi:hypothetical protein